MATPIRVLSLSLSLITTKCRWDSGTTHQRSPRDLTKCRPGQCFVHSFSNKIRMPSTMLDPRKECIAMYLYTLHNHAAVSDAASTSSTASKKKNAGRASAKFVKNVCVRLRLRVYGRERARARVRGEMETERKRERRERERSFVIFFVVVGWDAHGASRMIVLLSGIRIPRITRPTTGEGRIRRVLTKARHKI